MNRKFWIIVHRWVGLAMAVFLIIVGLTGCLLAFYSDLEQWVNPQLYPAMQASQKPMNLAELAVHVEKLEPHARVRNVIMGDPGWRWVTVEPRLDPKTDQPYLLNYDQVLLNPYTGEVVGKRQWGAISQGKINLMAFIYDLHYDLALSTFGLWVLGIVALFWTLDCFVGFYLTLPASKRTSAPQCKSYWQRWKPAWLVKWQGSAFRINFDLHRAGGLWLWLILLTFAWSSVYMNLWDTVYTWTTRNVMTYKAPWTELKQNVIKIPKLDWPAALATGQNLMVTEAKQRGFTIKQPVSIYLDREHGVYQYNVESSLDVAENIKRGETAVYFDANTGEQKLLILPTSQYTGNTVTAWLYNLHMANVFGLPYRIFVSVLGLTIVMLSITGVYIWLKKRAARH